MELQSTGIIAILIIGLASYTVAAQEVENLIINPDFQNGLQEWQLEVHADFVNAVMEVDNEGVNDNRSVFIEIFDIEPGAEVWRLQFKQVNIKVKQGQKYTWTFWAMAEEKTRPAEMWVGMEVDPWESLGGGKSILITDEWSEYQLTFTANQDFDNTRLSIQLGNSDESLWIDRLRFYEGDYVSDPDVDIDAEPGDAEPQESDNMVMNPEFEMGTAFWNLEVHGDFVEAIMLEDRNDGIGDNRCARIDISNIEAGAEVWRLQFKQVNHRIEAGETYTWSFWARAEDWRQADVWVGMEVDPWSTLGPSETIELESEWQEYHFTFDAQESFDNTRLAIQLASSPETVWVDHVRFYEGDYEEEDFEEIMRDISVTPAGKLATTWGQIRSSE